MEFLAVDLVNSTRLASQHGDGVAMRARNLLERRDVSPGPPLEVRAGIAYGEILLDARGARHGAPINKAFRLVSVPPEAFVAIQGEPSVQPLPDRNRVLLDEESANELGAGPASLRQVGVCRLCGFSGLHRVFELGWRIS